TRGDLPAAAEVFRSAAARGAVPPGVLRRTQLVALSAGNLPLAHELGRRLIERHADVASDHPDDGGRPYSEIAAVELPAAPAPLVALPAGRVVELQPPSEQSSLRYVEVAHAEGFPRPAHLPLLIAVDDARLLGFALEPLPADVSEHRFAVDLRTAPVGPVLV